MSRAGRACNGEQAIETEYFFALVPREGELAAWRLVANADAWFLEAVAGAGSSGEPSLSRVIAEGDAINKAIFTKREIEEAVNRLTAARVLLVDGDRYLLTQEGSSLRERAPTVSVFDRLDWLREALTEMPSTDASAWRLDEQAYLDAIAVYKSEFRQRLLEAKDRTTPAPET